MNLTIGKSNQFQNLGIYLHEKSIDHILCLQEKNVSQKRHLLHTVDSIFWRNSIRKFSFKINNN